MIPLTYTPAEGHLDLVRSLRQPSAVGLLSISPAILKTASGLLAPMIGARHSLHLFLMEAPHGSGSSGSAADTWPSIRHYATQEYPAGPGVRSFAAAGKKPPHPGNDPGNTLTVHDGTEAAMREKDLLLQSAADLGAIDLLFCDSVTYAAVKHQRRIMYRLLSDESLRDVASAAESLVLKAVARNKQRPQR